METVRGTMGSKHIDGTENRRFEQTGLTEQEALFATIQACLDEDEDREETVHD